MDYPDQIDAAWLACDSAEHLAAMITAGEGPIPARVIAREAVDIEEALLHLPVISESRLTVQVPDPTSFIELSRRGLFVYDWTDVHGVRSAEKKAYELVCLPATPLQLPALPIELNGAAFKLDGVLGDAFLAVP